MALLPSIRAVVSRLHATLPLYNIQTFDQITATLLVDRRFAMVMLTIFAVLGFVLATVGLYGVLSYLVQVVGLRVPALGNPDPAVIGGVTALILVVAALATWGVLTTGFAHNRQRLRLTSHYNVMTP